MSETATQEQVHVETPPPTSHEDRREVEIEARRHQLKEKAA